MLKKLKKLWRSKAPEIAEGHICDDCDEKFYGGWGAEILNKTTGNKYDLHYCDACIHKAGIEAIKKAILRPRGNF